MSDDFEDLVKRWMRDRAATDRPTLVALAGNVAALPPRRRRQPSQLAAAAAIIVALGLVAVALVPRINHATGVANGPVPPDPAAFAGDPRLARCGASVDTASDVFEMAHARDYQHHIPAMLLSPELDVDAPAFVVVYKGLGPFNGAGGAAPPPGQTWPPPSLGPGLHDICVLVGADPATAERDFYGSVDTAGLTVALASTEPDATSSSTPPRHPPEPIGTPTVQITPGPAPSWAADLAGQLDCDGPVASVGGEYPDGSNPETFGDTAAAGLDAFLGPSNFYASLPAAGFQELHEEPHWASFGHLIEGHPKAIILMSDVTEYGPGWTVVGLRACDASEFDPSVPLTFPLMIWSDASGARVSTETIRSYQGPTHCGWDSATWLFVDGDLFFRDPKGVMDEWTKTTFDADAKLPGRAVDSGYRSGKRRLWLDPGRDAYLISSGTVERWPRSSDPGIGCA